jgi:hypothetical protein
MARIMGKTASTETHVNYTDTVVYIWYLQSVRRFWGIFYALISTIKLRNLNLFFIHI